MLSLAGLLAFPLFLTLTDIAPTGPSADSPTAQPTGSNVASRDDVFFHPLGFALFLGAIPQDFGPVPPVYPTDPGGDPPPPSGGDPPPPSGGDPSTSGGDPSTSGGDPHGSDPPSVNAPEPATLLSGLIGIGLAGLYRFRQRRRSK